MDNCKLLFGRTNPKCSMVSMLAFRSRVCADRMPEVRDSVCTSICSYRVAAITKRRGGMLHNPPHTLNVVAGPSRAWRLDCQETTSASATLAQGCAASRIRLLSASLKRRWHSKATGALVNIAGHKKRPDHLRSGRKQSVLAGNRDVSGLPACHYGTAAHCSPVDA
jgi:hypothetical protein